jgi:ribosomal protein S18 acetylase RimI-like enzyme
VPENRERKTDDDRGCDTAGKETPMSSRGLLTVRRETSVDAFLAAELDAMFDEGISWDAEQGRRFLAHPDTLLLVARWHGEACGFLTAYRLQRFDRRGAEVLLYEIGVLEPFQRRGVGRALVEEAKRWAVDMGADELWVMTEDDNVPARALYAATGGREESNLTMFDYGLGP